MFQAAGAHCSCALQRSKRGITSLNKGKQSGLHLYSLTSSKSFVRLHSLALLEGPNSAFMLFFPPLFIYFCRILSSYAFQGLKSGISRLLPSPRLQVESPQSSSAPCSAQANLHVHTLQTSFTTNPNRVDWQVQTLSPEFEDVDSNNNPRPSSFTHPAFGSTSHDASLLSHGVAGKML